MEADVIVPVPRGEASATYGIVMNLLRRLENKGHCIVMDNYFCSIPLLEDLVRKGIFRQQGQFGLTALGFLIIGKIPNHGNGANKDILSGPCTRIGAFLI
jgi:hypothetical protein